MQEFDEDIEYYLASKSKRFSNYILDAIGSYMATGIVLAILNGISIIDFYQEESKNAIVFVYILTAIGYWIGAEYFLGRTFGKHITQTRVINIDGTKPSFQSIVKRNLCRLIPFEPFSFFGSKPIGWHDSLSGTRVVMDGYVAVDDDFTV